MKIPSLVFNMTVSVTKLACDSLRLPTQRHCTFRLMSFEITSLGIPCCHSENALYSYNTVASIDIYTTFFSIQNPLNFVR